MQRTLVVAIILLFIPCYSGAAAKAPQQQLTIIAGAESHGMLDACECEVEPGGGVAKRASLLNSLGDRENLLLLDAGGFAAGGIYDDYTEGRSGDSVRTALMIAAMGIMQYDAVAVGDDDLQFGGTWLTGQAKGASLPLVSANCFIAKKKRFTSAYCIVQKAGFRVGITAVITDEKLFPIDSSIFVADPFTSLREIWKEMAAQSDVQVILSHLGQEASLLLAQAFPECDLIVNGHRKSDKKPVSMIGNLPVLQFGFQGKSLAGITLQRAGTNFRFGNGQWHDVVPEIPDDQRLTDLLKKRGAPAAPENVYDLYIMSQCTYGLEALENILTFSRSDRSVRWNLWFIGDIDNDTVLSSLHGKGEVNDEKMWLAIKAIYPTRWTEFLLQRTAAAGPTKQLAERLGLNVKKLDDWVARNGTRELQEHYNRSTRLSIDASPTLLVNNRPFGRNVTTVNLRRFHCSSQKNTALHCDSLPQCGENADCRTPGKLGLCIKGKCEYREAVPFDFTVLIADSTIEHPEKKVVRTTMDLFPGAAVQIVGSQTARGKQLLQKYRPDALPYYIFGSEVKLAHNYAEIQGGLVDNRGVLTFQKGIVQANYHLHRKKSPGKFMLFIDPFFEGISDVFRILASDSLYLKRVSIEPVIYMAPDAARPGTDEGFRQEEALRWLVLGTLSQPAYRHYLEAYAAQPGSSYWQPFLVDSGISPDSLRVKVIQSKELLAQQWETMQTLEIREPAMLLIDNVETVPISGERKLRSLLSQRIR